MNQEKLKNDIYAYCMQIEEDLKELNEMFYDLEDHENKINCWSSCNAMINEINEIMNRNL